MAKPLSIAFFALVLLVKMTSSQFPCQVNPVPYHGPPIPSIPDTFSMDIINNVMDEGSLLSKSIYHLYVDAGRKLAVEGMLSFYYMTINGDVGYSQNTA